MNNDKEICKTLTYPAAVCCYGKDEFLRDCQNMSESSGWISQYLDIVCNDVSTKMSMKDICPDKVNIIDLPIDNDLPICDTLTSIPKACCYGRDNYLRDCPYRVKKYGWNKDFFNFFCNQDSIKLDMKDICPQTPTPTPPTPPTPSQPKSLLGFMTSPTGISISLGIIILIVVIFLLLSKKKKGLPKVSFRRKK